MGNTYHIVQFIAPNDPNGNSRRIVWCENIASVVGGRGPLMTLREDMNIPVDDETVRLTWLDVHVRVNEYKRLLRRYCKEAK